MTSIVQESDLLLTQRSWSPELARPEDVPQIVTLLASAAPETIPLYAEEVEARLADFIVLRSSVSDGDGQVVAVAALCDLDRQRTELSSVAVRKEHRGLGLGRRVVRRALAEASQALDRGKEIICFTFRPGFFAGLGFEPLPAGDLPEKPGRPQTYRGQARRAMKWRMSEVPT